MKTPKENKFQYHKDGTVPKNGEVFVFGSNLAGRHGAGAAKEAADRFGAVNGIGIGLVGSSYAIPTKDKNIETMPIDQIEPFIGRFVVWSRHQSEKFFVTAIGCGLAGYKAKDIAPLFRGASANCNFPEEWKKFLEVDEETAA